MKPKSTSQQQIQTRRVAPGQKQRAKSSAGKPRNPLLDSLSGVALIKALRGSLPDKPSLVADLRHERRRDDRAKTRKFMALDRERNPDARIPPMPKLSAQARARKIKLLLFDVDGVLTDGKLFFLPEDSRQESRVTGQSAQGQIEMKGFNAHDGAAISLARLGGLKTGLITNRASETVALRARDLKLDHIHQGVKDKRACFEAVVKQEGLQLDEAAFVGDDVIDLPAMRAGGLAIAVQNARAEVKQDAHYITPHAGGGGALRDAVELILNAQGKWERVVEEYIGEKVAKGSSQRSAVSHQRRSKSR